MILVKYKGLVIVLEKNADEEVAVVNDMLSACSGSSCSSSLKRLAGP